MARSRSDTTLTEAKGCIPLGSSTRSPAEASPESGGTGAAARPRFSALPPGAPSLSRDHPPAPRWGLLAQDERLSGAAAGGQRRLLEAFPGAVRRKGPGDGSEAAGADTRQCGSRCSTAGGRAAHPLGALREAQASPSCGGDRDRLAIALLGRPALAPSLCVVQELLRAPRGEIHSSLMPSAGRYACSLRRKR